MNFKKKHDPVVSNSDSNIQSKHTISSSILNYTSIHMYVSKDSKIKKLKSV